MNDEDIKKALECCVSDDYDESCVKCPARKYKGCDYTLNKNALDLINRQQAEIERLKEFIAEIARSDRELKSEAIRECVNKYTEMLIDEYHLRTDLQIANLKRLEKKVLAEMIGGENEIVHQ